MAISSDNKVDEKVRPNHRLTIACPTGRTTVVGMVFSMFIAMSTLLARLYCKRKKILVEPILSRVGYIMSVFLLMSGILLATSPSLSPKVKTATNMCLLLSIAYAFVAIVLVPDLLAVLSTKANRTQLSEKFLTSLTSKRRLNT